VIVICIPAILIANLILHNNNFTTLLNQELQSKAELTAQALSTTVTDSLSQPDVISAKISALIKNSDIKEITVYKYNNNAFSVVSTTNPENEVKVLDAPSSNTAWNEKRAIATQFGSANTNDHVYTVTTPIYDADGNAAALLVSQISVADIDALVKSNNQQTLYFLLASILVIFILLINHFHFVGYAKLLYALKNVNQLKDRFLNRTTMDLQEPLMNIKSSSESFNKLYSQSVDANGLKMISDINAESVKMLEVVKELLDLSKIEHNQIELQRQPINPMKICADVVAKLAPVTMAKQINISLNIDKTQGLISVDQSRLSQEISMLLNVFIEHMENGEIKIAYEQITKNRWSVTISSDTFRYKDAANVSQTAISNPADQSANLTEFGVSYWIVEQLTQLMGGHIETQFNPPSQLIFRLIYPEVKVVEFPNSAEAVAPTATTSNIYA
jgi:K+-sensing histidine kinase KdpD